MFVHELNQFVTVQQLEETPAVLSTGKLCKNHEWVSGQEPRLTNNGKNIICKTDNCVPLVIPRSSVNSESSSSPTSQPHESLRPEADQACGNRAAPSSPSGSVFERSDEQGTRAISEHPQPNEKRDDQKDADEPLADLPFWSEDFKDNLVDTELPAPAHSSRESDLEHPAEVVTKSRKHSIYTHFLRDRNCDVSFRTKMTKASCRRRTGEALPRAEKIGDLMTADHTGPQ